MNRPTNETQVSPPTRQPANATNAVSSTTTLHAQHSHPRLFSGTPPTRHRPEISEGGMARGGGNSRRGEGGRLSKNYKSRQNGQSRPEAHVPPMGISEGDEPARSHVQTGREAGFSDPRRARMVQQVREDAPSRVGVFLRVYSGSASPREAIKAKCLECCWMDEAGIRECTGTACPLWGFRPYQKGGGSHEP